ncbi:MAG: PQQ-binding-like beta-propeller repeat protein, partial [Planctomycetaceae bacterium]|nr:PQQ-binding-like beta-propeller repeat protein [Planctomycetaceae bacterium]
MPHLEIRLPNDGPRTIELDKRTPLSVGQHPSNDICIDGDDVELMHCRVSWNKKAGFEVVSAAIDGVDVNGTLVQKSVLTSGDVMRIGDANITFVDGDRDESETVKKGKDDLAASTFGLRPLTDEFSAPLPPVDDVPLTADEIIADEAPLTAEEIILEEPEKKSRRKKSSTSKDRDRSDDRKSRRKEKKTDDDGGSMDESEWPDLSAEDLAAVGETPRESRKPSASAKVPSEPDAPEEAIPPRRHQRHVRPGERDPVRSPLVQSLGAGAAILALVGLTFYFILGRQTTQQKFDEAKALMDEGKYTQAIRAFEDFLVVYPRGSLSDEAQVNMWISRVDRPISGASPNWAEGLTELEGFINARRDAEDFEQQHDVIRQRAEQISEGAAISAGKAYDRNLLAVSDTARNIVKSFQPDEALTADLMKRIETERRKSEAAILKYESLTAALADIDKALKDKQPIAALGIRRELISRYPEFASDPKIVTKLTEILTAEREAITANDDPVDAVTEDHASAFPPTLVLTFHARSRTDEVSVGRTVYGLAKDCCYAVDSITGEPVWRRVIGWDTPFFPVPITTSVHALLLFDTNHNELVCVDQQSGALLWRQPAVQDVNGPPLVEEGQAYVVSSSGSLSKVELDSGRVISRLDFSQPLLSPPAALNDDARLVICGDQEVVYTLTKRPFECAAVSYLGQKPQSVSAPVLPMGALVMIAENLPGERSQLHVLDTRSDGGKLTEAMSAQVPGHVVDPPVIRGRDVFVPSTGERVSAFSATDEPGQSPLTEGARYETEGAALSPMYLATGPDRQVWMASRTLRKLQLLTDTIEPGSKVIDLGIATQELQQIGKQIYVGSRQPYADSVTLFQTDRDQLTSQWQIVIGGELLSFGTFPNQQGLVAVSESGDVFRINESQLQEGGFLTDSTMRLKLPEGLTTPLQAIQSEDGRVLVWCGDPMPQIWIVNRLGQVERNFPLPAALQSAPARLGKFLALPLAGRVQLISDNGAPSNVQDFTLPQSDA